MMKRLDQTVDFHQAKVEIDFLIIYNFRACIPRGPLEDSYSYQKPSSNLSQCHLHRAPIRHTIIDGVFFSEILSIPEIETTRRGIETRILRSIITGTSKLAPQLYGAAMVGSLSFLQHLRKEFNKFASIKTT